MGTARVGATRHGGTTAAAGRRRSVGKQQRVQTPVRRHSSGGKTKGATDITSDMKVRMAMRFMQLKLERGQRLKEGTPNVDRVAKEFEPELGRVLDGSTIRKIVNQTKEAKHHRRSFDKGRRPRPREELITMIKEHLERDDMLTYRELRGNLNADGVEISVRDEGQEWVVHSIYKTKYTDEHDSELEDNFVYYYNANDWDSADGEFPEEDEGLLECSVMSEFEAFAQWI